MMDENPLVTISSLAQECLFPKLERTLEEMTNVEQFMKGHILMVEEKLDLILKTIVSCTKIEDSSQLLLPLIILVGEHYVGPVKPWVSQKTQIQVTTLAKELEIRIIASDNFPSTTATNTHIISKCFLANLDTCVSPRKSLFFQCLRFLHSKLRKDDWKLFPASVTSFELIIAQLKYPYLSDFIGDILPTSLLFADDYNDEYKIHGINCLDHAIKNLNKSDLVKDNWTAVIYNAFHGLLHDKNPIIIDKLIPLLYSILKIMEVDPHLNSDKFTKYDETMRKILFAVEFCSERHLKPVWVHHLTEYLRIMGHATLHWIDKICDILLNFTTTNDTILWVNILKCLQVCIKNTWLKPNSLKTAEIILRIVLNVTVLDIPNLTEESRLEIFDLSKDCLHLLKFNSDYSLVSSQIEEIKENDKMHPKFRVILNDF